MDCPRCGEPDVSDPECPRCGVIVAKARSPRPRPEPAATEPEPAEMPSSRRAGLPVLLLVGLAAALWALWRADAPPPGPPTLRETSAAPPPRPDAEPLAPLPPPPLIAESAPIDPVELPDDTAAADRATAARLAGRLQRRLSIEEGHLLAAEDLFARYGSPASRLLEGLLLNAAAQERSARRHAEAIELLRRAAQVAPASVHPRKALVAVLLDSGDWPEAEASARAAVALAPGDTEAVQGLAYALHRQDRSREAVELLESFLDDHDEASAQALLARIRNDVAPEAGLTEQRLAHFHVRYDGAEHADVGRAVLRVLDRHYATLVRTFDHKPVSPIPVVLLSRESYYDATGAPAWSGGRYDSFDGRVRLPIGGLTTALTPELDDTLLHELTHAFVTDRSRGVAPREIQEGLAQLLEGKRVEDLLDETQMTALAEGRIQGVAGFYLASLSFAEYLSAQRGQGGINDLLEAMAETGNADAAFEDVYGRDFASFRRDWETRLRNRYGR
jgi:tetratricopeptide (TPR) repeat protein